MDIIHYTVGFILQHLYIIEIEKVSSWYWLSAINKANTILFDDKILEDLPTSIIEHRQQNIFLY